MIDRSIGRMIPTRALNRFEKNRFEKHRVEKGRYIGSKLSFEKLEDKQMLTVFFGDWGLGPAVKHIPQDTGAVILSNLTESPQVLQRPEHGQLEFDSVHGTMTYRPDTGFTGEDHFRLQSSHLDSAVQNSGFNSLQAAEAETPIESEHTIRVWETVFAAPDWELVRPGTTTTIDVMGNDYAFLKQIFETDGTKRIGGYAWQQDSSGFGIVHVSSDSGSAVSISEGGASLTYAAPKGFIGTDVVTYIVEDAHGNQSETTVTIEVSDQLDLDPTGRTFVSDAQMEQSQIDAWLETFASRMTNDRVRFIASTMSVAPTQFALVTDTEFQFARGADGMSADQVQGIEEGDIVKSNGNLLYYVSHDNSGQSEFLSYISIVDLSDPDNPALLSNTGFTNRIHDIFLNDDRIAVVLDQNYGNLQNPLIRPFLTQHNSEFQLIVLDVSRSESLLEVYRATIDGRYDDARLVGDELYIVSNSNYLTALSPSLVISPDSDIVPVSPGQFINTILERDDNFGLPSITVQSGGDSERFDIGADQFVRREGATLTTMISTFDLSSQTGDPVDMDLLETNGVFTIYASVNAMYLFDSQSVIKMDFVNDVGGVAFAADGELQASLQSQFAADEFEGFLRVAARDRTDSSNDIYVFDQVEDTLVMVGSVEDMAPGERIFATLFEGEQAYLVTFEQIDPLFVIDMSDPTDPRVTGELHIPGVSGYLQVIGDGLLLAIGRDANVNTGVFGDLQVSLFDVSDSASPQLLDRYSFAGGISTQTPLIGFLGGAPNQHALTFDSMTGTLALPVYSSFYSPNGALFQDGASAIALFNIDRVNGIREAGQIDFDEQAYRTLIHGDHFVFLSADTLKTSLRKAPTDVTGTLELPAPKEGLANPVIGRQIDPPTDSPADAPTEPPVIPVTVPEPAMTEPDSVPVKIDPISTEPITPSIIPKIVKPIVDDAIDYSEKQETAINKVVDRDAFWLAHKTWIAQIESPDFLRAESIDICFDMMPLNTNDQGMTQNPDTKTETTRQVDESPDQGTSTDQVKLDAWFASIVNDLDDSRYEIEEESWVRSVAITP